MDGGPGVHPAGCPSDVCRTGEEGLLEQQEHKERRLILSTGESQATQVRVRRLILILIFKTSLASCFYFCNSYSFYVKIKFKSKYIEKNLDKLCTFVKTYKYL